MNHLNLSHCQRCNQCLYIHVMMTLFILLPNQKTKDLGLLLFLEMKAVIITTVVMLFNVKLIQQQHQLKLQHQQQQHLNI